MRIFLSYASQDRAIAESIYLALREQGHDVFFDRAALPAGEEYHSRIREAIERAELFVFLLSPDAIDGGSYTLTELAIAQKTWDSPGGRVLPVMLRHVELDAVPAYLKAVTLLETDGNLVAAVGDAVRRIASERRRAVLRTAGIVAIAVAVIVGALTFYWNHRAPGQQVTGKDGARAMLVPAGPFTMGDDENSPLREVYVDAFYIDEKEITVARYAKFLQASGAVNPPDEWDQAKLDQDGELPVVGIGWRDAEAYCRWSGKRLPTESEWEKAARGTDRRIYPWGNDEPTAARANFGKSGDSAYRGGLSITGSHDSGKSPYGVQDLAGNVSEWIADWYAESFPHSDVRNPKGPENGTGKVIRGGGWYDPAVRIKSTKRYFASPEHRSDDIGFRCARDAGG